MARRFRGAAANAGRALLPCPGPCAERCRPREQRGPHHRGAGGAAGRDGHHRRRWHDLADQRGVGRRRAERTPREAGAGGGQQLSGRLPGRPRHAARPRPQGARVRAGHPGRRARRVRPRISVVAPWRGPLARAQGATPAAAARGSGGHAARRDGAPAGRGGRPTPRGTARPSRPDCGHGPAGVVARARADPAVDGDPRQRPGREPAAGPAAA